MHFLVVLESGEYFRFDPILLFPPASLRWYKQPVPSNTTFYLKNIALACYVNLMRFVIILIKFLCMYVYIYMLKNKNELHDRSLTWDLAR